MLRLETNGPGMGLKLRDLIVDHVEHGAGVDDEWSRIWIDAKRDSAGGLKPRLKLATNSLDLESKCAKTLDVVSMSQAVRPSLERRGQVTTFLLY